MPQFPGAYGYYIRTKVYTTLDVEVVIVKRIQLNSPPSLVILLQRLINVDNNPFDLTAVLQRRRLAGHPRL